MQLFWYVLSRFIVDMLAPVAVFHFSDWLRYLGDTGSGTCVTAGWFCCRAHHSVVSRWCTGLGEPWLYRYTDFGEGRGGSPQPVLRAVVEVSTLGAPATFQAVVDTGGPITVIASDLLDSGGDPVATGTTMMLRLGGSTTEVMLHEMTLEIRPPRARSFHLWTLDLGIRFHVAELIHGSAPGGTCVTEQAAAQAQ